MFLMLLLPNDRGPETADSSSLMKKMLGYAGAIWGSNICQHPNQTKSNPLKDDFLKTASSATNIRFQAIFIFHLDLICFLYVVSGSEPVQVAALWDGLKGSLQVQGWEMCKFPVFPVQVLWKSAKISSFEAED